MPGVWRLAQVVAVAALSFYECSDLIGQTENQLEQLYRRSDAFEIRPGVNVYPAFAPDGNVCRMVIAKYPKVDNKLADTNTSISPALIKEIEDELAPPDHRGRELSPYLSPDSFVAGGASLTKKDYENASISVYETSGVAYAIVITLRYHPCSN